MTVKHMLEATRWPADLVSRLFLSTHDRLTIFPLLIFLSYFLLEPFSISFSPFDLKFICDGDKSMEEEEFVLLYRTGFPFTAVIDIPSSTLSFY